MKTVYVGLSGGVDSSVTAALLLEQGYTVVGVHMKNWAQNIGSWHCPWQDDMRDAKRVAVQLGIEFKIFDFQKEYKTQVVDYLIEGYKAGITPNPDIMCNQEVKFKLFLDAAMADGADMIATGHYARSQNGQLKIAADAGKDQTYFLYRITEAALQKTLFPLGDLQKSQVREKAAELGLVTADKKDSVGICFVGKIGIKDFLKNYVDVVPGPIVDAEGAEVGVHEGALFYTIGQRHGLNVGGGLPYYVTGKDMQTNTVFVTTDLDDEKLWSNTIELAQAHWITQAPAEAQNIQVRTRHLGELVDATIKDGIITLSKEMKALSPGQSAVVYDGETVLGGGIIS